MEIKFNDIMQKLLQARRDKIEARAAELMTELNDDKNQEHEVTHTQVQE